MFFVYILYSEESDKYYVGQTDNLDGHNNGMEEYTKKYLPWILMLTIEKSSRSDAVRLERKLKNISRERLISFIDNYHSA